MTKDYNSCKRAESETGMFPLNWLLHKHLPNGKERVRWWVRALGNQNKILKYYNICKSTRAESVSGMPLLNWLFDKSLPNGKEWVRCFVCCSNYYNVCSLKRAGTESGMFSLNWLLDNALPNGKLWVGCALLLKNTNITISSNYQEQKQNLECFRSIGCSISPCQMENCERVVLFF